MGLGVRTVFADLCMCRMLFIVELQRSCLLNQLSLKTSLLRELFPLRTTSNYMTGSLFGDRQLESSKTVSIFETIVSFNKHEVMSADVLYDSWGRQLHRLYVYNGLQ